MFPCFSFIFVTSYPIPLQKGFGSGFPLHSHEVVEDNIEISCCSFTLHLLSPSKSRHLRTEQANFFQCFVIAIWFGQLIVLVCLMDSFQYQHLFCNGEPKTGSSIPAAASQVMTRRDQSLTIDYSFECWNCLPANGCNEELNTGELVLSWVKTQSMF